jgi:hypothetical protein
MPGKRNVRVIVCGSRHYADRRHVHAVLSFLHTRRHIVAVIQGGACGADSLASAWAHEHRVDIITVPAKWGAHGAAAGPIRNREMLEQHHPDGVVAFMDGAGPGTRSMVALADAAGVPVWRV